MNIHNDLIKIIVKTSNNKCDKVIFLLPRPLFISLFILFYGSEMMMRTEQVIDVANNTLVHLD